MKKFLISYSTAAAINLTCLFINLASYIRTRSLVLAFHLHNGDGGIITGFGVTINYRDGTITNPRSFYHHMYINPLGFIIFLSVTLAVTYSVTWIVFKIKSKLSRH